MTNLDDAFEDEKKETNSLASVASACSLPRAPRSSSNSSSRIRVSDVATEQEVETRVLSGVEGIDLNDNDDDDDEQEEIAQLYSDLAAEEIAKAALRANAKYNRKIRKSTAAMTQQELELGPLMTNHTAVSPDSNSKRSTNSCHSKKRHRRTATLQQELFGLTAAMTQMGATESFIAKSPVSERTSPKSTRRSTSSATSSDDRLKRTADLVVGHANQKVAQQQQEQQSEQLPDLESQKLDQQEEPEAATNTPNEDEDDETDERKVIRPYLKGAAATSKDVRLQMEAHWELFSDFCSSRKGSAKRYVKYSVLYLAVPCLALAFLLYYLFDNPMTGSDDDPNKASWSWWVLFIGVRQPIILALAVATQAFLIDFLVLRVRLTTRWFGPMVTLFFVQAKGRPFLMFAWALWDMALLLGDRDFAKHWMYWQKWIGLFNASNPSGNVSDAHAHHLLVLIAMIVGALEAYKRLFVSLFLGRQTFAHFGEQLADSMKNMLLIGDIAALAKTIERRATKRNKELKEHLSLSDDGSVTGGMQTLEEFYAKEESDNETGSESDQDKRFSAQAQAKAFITNRTIAASLPNHQRLSLGPVASGDEKESEHFTSSARKKLTQLVDEWEEPQTSEENLEKKINIGAVLQFRQSLSLMDAKYPFSPAFGIADTRQACVDSAQEVYERLLLRTPNREAIPFETLVLVAREKGQTFDDEKVRELIKLFRPDRDGKLTELDFVKSVDSIYKSIRLLTANIHNSRHTDAAFESLINFIFWFIVACFVLSAFGVDPVALVASFATIMISLAFVCGGTAAKYFEGMLFILLQRPYGVGDRIHLSLPTNETNKDGSSGWIVEKLNLHTTSLYWGATNERATIANGAISNFRVINAARSPNAQIYVNLMCPIKTPYEKIDTFRSAVEHFLKDRPREWLAFGGFRPTQVAVDRGFIGYVVIAQHRNSWQNYGSILNSKADLTKFCMEIAKELKMTYSSPPLPVELSIQSGNSGQSGEATPDNIAALAASVGAGNAFDGAGLSFLSHGTS